MALGMRYDLRRRAIAAFAAQDEIYGLCIFGKEARYKRDRTGR
jgi:hypothetical protein